MKKFFTTAIVLAALGGLLFAGGAQQGGGAAASDAPIVLKIGYITAETHPDTQALKEVFIPELEKNAPGKFKVELYPSGALGSDRELIESVQMGTIFGALPDTGVIANFDKRINVLALPYLFTTRPKAYAALDGAFGKKLNEYMSEKGFTNLGFQENGIRHITNNVRPVFTPADIKGMKIRTMEVPVHIEYFRAAGANPTPMAWGELYTALQQGVVDGEENPYVMIDDGKFYEVQQYVSETGHVFSINSFIASKAMIDKMPADLQKVVLDAGYKTSVRQRQLCEQLEQHFKEICMNSGKKMQVNTLTDAQKAEWVALTGPIYDKAESEYGKEIMDLARAAQK